VHAQYWRIWTPHGLRKIKHRLVIDIANPSAVDTYFPPLRSFDFFHGHSTVDGLLESPHGRAWTSASEDLHTAHAIKLWGYVNGNKNLQFMGSLMSAVIIRTAKRYTFMGRDNGIMPHDFKMNMVAGILFENKADHRRFKPIRPGLLSTVMTYGADSPHFTANTLSARPENCTREFDTLFWNHFHGFNCEGCRGLYVSNLATRSPKFSYQYHLDPSNERWLDDTLSRTWGLAFALL